MNNTIWNVFFANVAIWAFLNVDTLCEEMDDPANCQAWHAAIDAHRERIKAVPVHTSEHPYCLMSDCPCHDHAQEEPTSDEEMEQVMSEPSPLEVDIDENYHRSFFDGLEDLDDHPF